MKHIRIKDNALTATECKSIIDWFERHTDIQQPGRIGSQTLNTASKASTDIPRWFHLQEEPEKIIEKSLREGGGEYGRERPHIFRTFSKLIVDNSYILQRYKPGEGYYALHCEVGSPANMMRVLAWMIYLNDVPDGGTHFSEQEFDCEARQGRLVMWPAYFTHMHRGIVSEIGTKYIATGWIIWDGVRLD
ncbi:MAG: 2OG-Fe(II) oxygenase [Arenicellales bacterium]